jgi:hypothetical protein
VRKAIYAITLVLLGALIIQSVWGAEAKPARLPHASWDSRLLTHLPVFDTGW